MGADARRLDTTVITDNMSRSMRGGEIDLVVWVRIASPQR